MKSSTAERRESRAAERMRQRAVIMRQMHGYGVASGGQLAALTGFDPVTIHRGTAELVRAGALHKLGSARPGADAVL